MLQALGRLAANSAAGYMQRDNPAGNFGPMSPSKAGQAFPASTPRSKAGQAFPSNSPRKTSSPRKSFTPRKTISPRKRPTGSLRPGTAESTNEQREGAEAVHGLEKALATLIAEALRHRCCDYSIDSAWMCATHDSWRTVLAGSIHKSNMNRRLAAGDSFKAIEAAPAGGPKDDKPADQVQYLSLQLLHRMFSPYQKQSGPAHYCMLDSYSLCKWVSSVRVSEVNAHRAAAYIS